ncbi:MAG: AbrB/MazE/SpoVT family DNA-binding domain-containing protein [Deltaproteobacteria bacterium]|nr:AbrB/MazE/SpoVT family DNA-binding domain-containing protein [Deltaproteobacteria bacterium]
MLRITQKGQVTIPHQIRSILTIKSGDEVIFEIDEEKVVLKKKRGVIENLKNYVGFLSHLKGIKSDDVIDELRGKANHFRC